MGWAGLSWGRDAPLLTLPVAFSPSHPLALSPSCPLTLSPSRPLALSPSRPLALSYLLLLLRPRPRLRPDATTCDAASRPWCCLEPPITPPPRRMRGPSCCMPTRTAFQRTLDHPLGHWLPDGPFLPARDRGACAHPHHLAGKAAGRALGIGAHAVAFCHWRRRRSPGWSRWPQSREQGAGPHGASCAGGPGGGRRANRTRTS